MNNDVDADKDSKAVRVKRENAASKRIQSDLDLDQPSMFLLDLLAGSLMQNFSVNTVELQVSGYALTMLDTSLNISIIDEASFDCQYIHDADLNQVYVREGRFPENFDNYDTFFEYIFHSLDKIISKNLFVLREPKSEAFEEISCKILSQLGFVFPNFLTRTKEGTRWRTWPSNSRAIEYRIPCALRFYIASLQLSNV